MKVPAEMSDAELLEAFTSVREEMTAKADFLDARVNVVEGGPNNPELVEVLRERLALKSLFFDLGYEMRRRNEVYAATEAALDEARIAYRKAKYGESTS